MEPFDSSRLVWTREPSASLVSPARIEIVTKPHTDLWQRTYYHFRNDTAPVLQMTTGEQYFSFIVKTEFDSKVRFDQCGVALYLDSENWLKASIEYEDGVIQHLGSVVTNHGYSDWATTEIPAGASSLRYRLRRRGSGGRVPGGSDGETWRQMRICHLWEGGGPVSFGVYAASPENSCFKAVFTQMQLTECQWKAHDGQQPDEGC